MPLMSLPAADFSKFCWNRICLILAGTVRQGDGSFLPSFCHPATDFLSGWKRADPAPRWKKPDWTAASSGADLKIDSFFELLGLRPVHRRRKPVKRSFSHPCDGAADLISRIFPDHVVPWADPPGAKLCMTNCRVSYCACISGGRMENSCSGVSPGTGSSAAAGKKARDHIDGILFRLICIWADCTQHIFDGWVRGLQGTYAHHPVIVLPEKFHGVHHLPGTDEHGERPLPSDIQIGKSGLHHL